jgi:hypothetical protein
MDARIIKSFTSDVLGPLSRHYVGSSDGVRGSRESSPSGLDKARHSHGDRMAERVSHCTLAQVQWERLAGIKGWAGSKSHNPPSHLCFSHLAHHPTRVTPHAEADSPMASGRPLTGLGWMRRWGSGSPLTRAFAGSKSLPTPKSHPYCLCAHWCTDPYLRRRVTDRCVLQPDSPSGPTPHMALAPSYAVPAALGPTNFSRLSRMSFTDDVGGMF